MKSIRSKMFWFIAPGSLVLVVTCSFAWPQTRSAPPTPSPSPTGGAAEAPNVEPLTIPQPLNTLDATDMLSATSGGGIRILSDTMGVDFEPYMKDLQTRVRTHWAPLIPQVALPPFMKSGTVIIEFAIMNDGGLRGIKLVTSSGSEDLDQAALRAIDSSTPFPVLPSAYTKKYLLIRGSFIYNPKPADTTKNTKQSGAAEHTEPKK